MADSVFFDGVDDKMVFGIGNAAIPAGPITIAIVLKDNSFTLGNYDALLVSEDGGTTRWWSAYVAGDADAHFLLGTTAGDDTSAAVVALETLGLIGEWVICAVTKANGAVAPRYHRFDLANGWDHQDSPNTLANGTTPPSTAKIQLGLDSIFGSPADVNMLIFGIKDAVMNDAEIEELSNGYQSWVDAGFTEGVRLDAVTGLTSFTGGTMALESVTGAVLDPGDAPAWWVEPEDEISYKRFFGPAQLTGTAATLYTCPTGKRARVLNIHASNPSGSEVDLNLSIGTDATATRVYDDFPLARDSVESTYDPYDLAAGDEIQGWAGTAATVVLTITGYEVPE